MSQLDIVKYRVEFLFSLIFLIAAAFLNLQFLSGANLNSAIAGHDEYLTIKDVYSIIEPLSLKHFFLAVMHGSFLAYGSLMFYLDALIAFIPYKVFGLEGMVFSIRMTHAFFLVLGVSLLSKTFLHSTWSKVFFMFSALAVAHSFYFAMMPKPEPIQLFFFALFLYYFKENDWSFGRHFFWLGIAFGLKITLLIFLPFLFLVPFIEKDRLAVKSRLKKGFKSSLFFILGFFVTVPYLLMAVIRPSYIDSFLEANLRNTSKSYDDSSISLMDWLGDGLAEPYLGQENLGVLFIILIACALGYKVYMSFRKQAFKGELLLGLLGLTFILFIALKVDRLWPHYMWMGYILAVLALNELHDSVSRKGIKRAILITNLCIVLLIAFRFVNTNFKAYFLVAQQPEIVQRLQESEQLFQYIETSFEEGIDVATDGTIHYPYEQFIAAHPYHPFDTPLSDNGQTSYDWFYNNYGEIWDKPNDVVVFGDRHPLKDMTSLKKRFPQWDMEKHAAVYVERIKTDFELDTMIGSLEVYRRIR